jgi:catechol 2,3-dioxygenase-like lactoylglutathione lyase family enzyme
MEQRISLITLGVADLKRSKNFYERLGWKRTNTKAEEIAFFQAGGMALALSASIARKGRKHTL